MQVKWPSSRPPTPQISTGRLSSEAPTWRRPSARGLTGANRARAPGPLATMAALVVIVCSAAKIEALLQLQQVPSSNSSISSDMSRAHSGNMSSMLIVPSSTPMTNASLNVPNPAASGPEKARDSQRAGQANQASTASSLSSAQSQAPGAGSSKGSSSGAKSNSPGARLKQQQQQQTAPKPGSPRAGTDSQMVADDTQDAQIAYMTINNGTPTSVVAPEMQRGQVKPSEESGARAHHPTGPGMGGKTTIVASGRASAWPSSQWRPKVSAPRQQLYLSHHQQQQQQSDSDLGLDASLTGQLERPSGYSYGEPSSPMSSQPTSGYTYVSQISPARHEIAQTADQQQRNRARQQQYASGRAHEPFGQPGMQPGMRPALDQQLANQLEQPGGSSSSLAGSKSASQLPQFNTQQRPSDNFGQSQVSLASGQPASGVQHQLAAANPCKPLYASMAGQEPLPGQLLAGANEIGSSLTGSAQAKYVRAGFGTRLRSQFVFKVIRADSLTDCELACSNALADACRSFNYRANFGAENCELSRLELRALRLEDSTHFEQHTQFDFYALDLSGPQLASSAALMMSGSNLNYQQQQLAGYGAGHPFGGQLVADDCLDVSQSCSQDGMEFTLRTSEPFNGRIYTYGFYESCFVDGQGSTNTQLRISRSNGFPRCGTQQFGDLMTNIVVVQFNDYVQTTRDKKYNLTCYFSGPGEAVVTSNYLDTKIDERSHPIQIEHLPPQNVITSNVHLRILYRGQPTNTIAVGDLLTFRLETRSSQSPATMGHLRGELQSAPAAAHNEIFATNVIAKDPYSGRQVQLIDPRGCPIDPVNVFPELQRTPDGALESEFYAFKIPDSNFLIFQATVRTCKAPCEPVICQSAASSFSNTINQVRVGQQQLVATKGHYLMAPGGGAGSHLSQVPSWGKRKRRRRATDNANQDDETDELLSSGESIEHVIPVRMAHEYGDTRQVQTIRRPELGEAEQEVKEMFRVFMSRAEIGKRQIERQQQLIRQPARDIISGDGQTNYDFSNTTDDNTSAAEALPINGSEQPPISVCMTQSSYYVILFTVISLSLIVLSIASVCLYLTRSSKLHISDSIADVMY